MTVRDVRLLLEDIYSSIKLIQQYMSGISEADFASNRQLQDAVMRRLEVMGEAAKNVPLAFRKRHPEIPWQKIAGMRDVLIHGYFGVNLERVWIVVKDDLPQLKSKIGKLLKSQKG